MDFNRALFNSDYGGKHFTGVIDDNGVYRVREIFCAEDSSLYRYSPLHKIQFSESNRKTTVSVKVINYKDGIKFYTFLVLSIVLWILSFAGFAVEYLWLLLLPTVVCTVLAVVFGLIGKRNVDSVKESLLYMLKYKDKYKL